MNEEREAFERAVLHFREEHGSDRVTLACAPELAMLLGVTNGQELMVHGVRVTVSIHDVLPEEPEN